MKNSGKWWHKRSSLVSVEKKVGKCVHDSLEKKAKLLSLRRCMNYRVE